MSKNISQIAKQLGSLGGKARARALSKTRRKEIASFSARTRWLSAKAEGRIKKNLRYLAMVKVLRKAGKKYEQTN